MKKSLIILLTIIVLVMLGKGGAKDSKVVSSTPQKQEQKQETIYKPGDEIDLGDYTIKLEMVTISHGAQFIKPKPGKKWVSLKFTVKNKTDKTIFVNLMGDTYIMDNEGNQYSWASTNKTMEDDTFVVSEIMPKAVKTGWIGYEVPEDLTKAIIYHQYGTFDNKIIKIEIDLTE